MENLVYKTQLLQTIAAIWFFFLSISIKQNLN